MKELSIEEKAKAYDEALIVAKQWYNDSNTTKKEKYLLKGMFSELVESEDERIRRRIIHALHGDVLEMSEIKEAVAWLEKQGEKPISEDVIEAANEWYKTAKQTSSWWDNGIQYFFAEYHEAFKAGAEWQKSLDKNEIY